LGLDAQPFELRYTALVASILVFWQNYLSPPKILSRTPMKLNIAALRCKV